MSLKLPPPVSTCRQPAGASPDPDLCSKWCSDHPFITQCDGCGEDVEVTYGSMEVIGAYHSGCFGYPMCVCDTPHKGWCK